MFKQWASRSETDLSRGDQELMGEKEIELQDLKDRTRQLEAKAKLSNPPEWRGVDEFRVLHAKL